MTLPVSIVAPIATELGQRVWPYVAKGNLGGAMSVLTQDYTGYHIEGGDWELKRMKNGALPLLVGVLVHKVAGQLGLNRAIARSGVPWIRI